MEATPQTSCRRNLPSFTALRAFERAATLGSFKAAANALSQTTSAVSHQIRALEAELGQELFKRHPHGVELTDIARIYLRFVEVGFNHIESGTRLARCGVDNLDRPVESPDP